MNTPVPAANPGAKKQRPAGGCPGPQTASLRLRLPWRLPHVPAIATHLWVQRETGARAPALAGGGPRPHFPNRSKEPA